MPAWQKPDPAAEIGKLKREVEELSRIVRRGKPAPNLRDLADGELAKVEDGQVPVYSATSGRWVPGAGGGGVSDILRVYSVTTQAVLNNTYTAVEYTSYDWTRGSVLSWSASNPSRVSYSTGGVYCAKARIGIIEPATGTMTGIRYLELKPSGGLDVIDFDNRHPIQVNGNTTPVMCSGTWEAPGAGYIEAYVQQTSGGARNLNTYVQALEVYRLAS